MRRRDFLEHGARAGLGLAAPGWARPARAAEALGWARRTSALAEAIRAGEAGPASILRTSRPARPRAVQAAPLRERFSDLARHFVFEYYPWYEADPWRHWDQWDRLPPDDIAANHVPRLGAYDSRSRQVLAQHAAWIASTGAGAINLSWWGRGSPER
jgi:hypothetical protein